MWHLSESPFAGRTIRIKGSHTVTTKAYLQFGGAACGLPNEPFQTIETECRIDLLPWQKAGFTYTATGYSRRIPSRYKVKHNGRWRRVYICHFSNAGTAYLGKPGAWLCTVDI